MPKARYRVTIAKKHRSRLNTEGWEVRVNGYRVGDISPLRKSGWTTGVPPYDGWYMSIRDDELGIPLRNTAGEIGVPEEDVKKAAIAYVKQCLAAKVALQELDHDHDQALEILRSRRKGNGSRPEFLYARTRLPIAFEDGTKSGGVRVVVTMLTDDGYVGIRAKNLDLRTRSYEAVVDPGALTDWSDSLGCGVGNDLSIKAPYYVIRALRAPGTDYWGGWGWLWNCRFWARRYKTRADAELVFHQLSNPWRRIVKVVPRKTKPERATKRRSNRSV